MVSKIIMACIEHKKYNLSYLANYWERTIEHLASVKGFSLEKKIREKELIQN